MLLIPANVELMVLPLTTWEKRIWREAQGKLAAEDRSWYMSFPSFAGFWYPANNICISLVLVLSLVQMLKHKRKVAGRAYTVLNLDKQLFVI
jgi:hypothetical protein